MLLYKVSKTYPYQNMSLILVTYIYSPILQCNFME